MVVSDAVAGVSAVEVSAVVAELSAAVVSDAVAGVSAANTAVVVADTVSVAAE